MQRADYSVSRHPGRTIERWILPTPRSRLQYLGDYKASSPHSPFPKHLRMRRSSSVPQEGLRSSIGMLPPPTVDGRFLQVRCMTLQSTLLEIIITRLTNLDHSSVL